MTLRRDDETTMARIRAAVRMRIEATSLRKTAAEIDLSPTGLAGFLMGKSAQHGTRGKVLRWYAQQSWREGSPASPDAVRASLSVLVQHLPEPVRDATAARIVEVLVAITEAEGLRHPGWMAELAGTPGSLSGEPLGGEAAAG